MSPAAAALSVVCQDAGAMPCEALMDFALLGIAALLASLPPTLTVEEIAAALQEEHP